MPEKIPGDKQDKMTYQETKRNYKDYTFWCKANEPLDENGLSIRYYVTKFLKDKFPCCRIIGQYFEFNKIDLYIIEEKLPVEIQSTTARYESRNVPHISQFESDCRKQIEENIKTLGRCWFFFDGELLRYLQTNITAHSSIQLDWLYKLMKEEKLTVFTIDYKGNIKERSLEDFNFISKVSTTCVVGTESDRRVLEKNKYDIITKVLDYFDVTQSELDDIGLEFHNNHKKGQQFTNFAMSLDNDRKMKIGYIFQGINNIYYINNIFDGDIIGNGIGLSDGKHIGIFESEGNSGSHNNRWIFIDYPEVSQLFPAYLRHKDKWDEFKGKWLTARQLEDIIKGNIDYNWYKKFENNENNQNINVAQSQNNDKEVNVEIKNRDQIITINIKNTKQMDIDNAWG